MSDLREQVAALESREVCTVAHDGDVTTCGYCQRDALRADNERLREMVDGKLLEDRDYLLAQSNRFEAEIMRHRGTLKVMTEWLDANQPDVFRRGLWDAIAAAKKEIRT